ncbi:MAG: hypothetical protein IT461_02180 [Planctomycetes bacterium]|nr:hypothetical protein [Planctomycetota bacterium]
MAATHTSSSKSVRPDHLPQTMRQGVSAVVRNTSSVFNWRSITIECASSEGAISSDSTSSG